MKIFIDTSVFIAYFIKQEAHNKEVTKKYEVYRKQKSTFLTSNYVLCEVLTWFNAKYHRSVLEKVVSTLARLENEGEVNILYIDKVIAKKSLDILIKFSDHKISFTDATSYILYKDFSLDEVFTLDDDFKKMRLNTSF